MIQKKHIPEKKRSVVIGYIIFVVIGVVIVLLAFLAAWLDNMQLMTDY